jgi:hypothetical protein
VSVRPRPLALLLSATAEAGVIAVVVHLLLEGSGVIGVDLPVFVPVFWIVFVGASLLAWSARGSELAAPACVVGAVVAGLVIGRGTLQTTVISVLVCVVVAFRVATLGLRDWREPDTASLWIGGVVVGLEALASGSVQRSWGPTLVLVIPVFFSASLASRAVVVWADQGSVEASSWIRRSGRLAIGLGAVAVVAVVTAGSIDRLATWVAPVGRAAVAALAWTVAQLARPIFWAFDRADLDTEGAADLLDRIRRSTQEARRAAADRADPNGGGGGLARVVGFLFLVGITALAIRLVRRLRASPSREISPLDTPADAAAAPLAQEAEPTGRSPSRGSRRLRSDDAVRRAYAEVLDALGARGLPTPPDATPAEFAREVAASHPDVAEDFGALTSAYEDVRYGAASLTKGAVDAVERHRRSLVAAVRRLPPPAEA